jgi:hypothetical protein
MADKNQEQGRRVGSHRRPGAPPPVEQPAINAAQQVANPAPSPVATASAAPQEPPSETRETRSSNYNFIENLNLILTDITGVAAKNPPPVAGVQPAAPVPSGPPRPVRFAAGVEVFI